MENRELVKKVTQQGPVFLKFLPSFLPPSEIFFKIGSYLFRFKKSLSAYLIALNSSKILREIIYPSSLKDKKNGKEETPIPLLISEQKKGINFEYENLAQKILLQEFPEEYEVLLEKAKAGFQTKYAPEQYRKERLSYFSRPFKDLLQNILEEAKLPVKDLLKDTLEETEKLPAPEINWGFELYYLRKLKKLKDKKAREILKNKFQEKYNELSDQEKEGQKIDWCLEVGTLESFSSQKNPLNIDGIDESRFRILFAIAYQPDFSSETIIAMIEHHIKTFEFNLEEMDGKKEVRLFLWHACEKKKVALIKALHERYKTLLWEDNSTNYLIKTTRRKLSYTRAIACFNKKYSIPERYSVEKLTPFHFGLAKNDVNYLEALLPFLNKNKNHFFSYFAYEDFLGFATIKGGKDSIKFLLEKKIYFLDKTKFSGLNVYHLSLASAYNTLEVVRYIYKKTQPSKGNLTTSLKKILKKIAY